MKNEDSARQASTPSNPDLQALRLPANYGAALGVKKVLMNVRVGKPLKSNFFQTHPSEKMTFLGFLLDLKETGEIYLVSEGVTQVIGELVRVVCLHAAIDRQGNISLIPVPMPGEDGTRNPWHESLAQVVERAKKKWTRISANMRVGAYDAFEASGNLPEPVWPEHDMNALVNVAFRGKMITSEDHPIIQTLLGKV